MLYLNEYHTFDLNVGRELDKVETGHYLNYPWHCHRCNLMIQNLDDDNCNFHGINNDQNNHLHGIHIITVTCKDSGPPFIKRTDVLPQDLVKPQSRVIRVQALPIPLKFNRLLSSNAARCLSNFTVLWSLCHPISRLWDFTRSCS